MRMEQTITKDDLNTKTQQIQVDSHRGAHKVC
jgi:hypothetical protein